MCSVVFAGLVECRIAVISWANHTVLHLDVLFESKAWALVESLLGGGTHHCFRAPCGHCNQKLSVASLTETKSFSAIVAERSSWSNPTGQNNRENITIACQISQFQHCIVLCGLVINLTPGQISTIRAFLLLFKSCHLTASHVHKLKSATEQIRTHSLHWTSVAPIWQMGNFNQDSFMTLAKPTAYFWECPSLCTSQHTAAAELD